MISIIVKDFLLYLLTISFLAAWGYNFNMWGEKSNPIAFWSPALQLAHFSEE